MAIPIRAIPPAAMFAAAAVFLGSCEGRPEAVDKAELWRSLAVASRILPLGLTDPAIELLDRERAVCQRIDFPLAMGLIEAYRSAGAIPPAVEILGRCEPPGPDDLTARATARLEELGILPASPEPARPSIEAWRIALEALESLEPEKRDIRLREALALALETQDLSPAVKVLDRLGEGAIPDDVRGGLRRLANEKDWREDLLASPDRWEPVHPEAVLPEFSPGKMAAWIRGYRRFGGRRLRIGPRTPSFCLSARLAVHAVAWDGRIVLDLWRERPLLDPVEAAAKGLISLDDREKSGLAARIKFAAHQSGLRWPVMAPFPGYAWTDSVSTGSSRDLCLEAMAGPEPRHRRILVDRERLQFEPGSTYRLRLSYWVPFREILLEVGDDRGEVLWRIGQGEVVIDPAEPLWLSVILFSRNGRPGEEDAAVVSLEIEELRFGGPWEGRDRL
jgi:hypothetical protein